jgi:hypothetical protein
MGLETDFFVASKEELEAAFPTWVPPAAKPNADKTWAPSRPFPKSNKSPRALFKAQMAAFQKFPHAQFKGVDPVKLDQLMAVLSLGKHASHESRPALLADEEECDEWMLLLTKAFVQALAKINKQQVKVVAEKWSESEEVQWSPKEAGSVVQALSDLAKNAASANKSLFLWMRL